LFATQRILEGALVGVYTGNSLGVFNAIDDAHDGVYILWVDLDDGRVEAIEVTSDMKYVNHSFDPNADFADEGLAIYATRDIEPGEEIFIDYGIDPEDEWH